ncbi:MAG: hypothetical protein AAF380_03255, partial [Bacteroidota bacterium]
MLNKSTKISLINVLIWCVLISLLFSVKVIAASAAYSLQASTTEEVKYNFPKYSADKPSSRTDEYKGYEDDSKDDHKEETQVFQDQLLFLPKNLRAMQIFPSPYEYAILSKHVYQDVVVGARVSGKYGDNEWYRLDDWQVYANLSEDAEGIFHTLFKSLGFPSGYRGILYHNRCKKQMVLAHRGTDPKNASAVETDIKSIAQNEIGAGQERLTIGLVKKALEKAKEANVKSLSFTGHSLGGWLAQVSLFVFFDQERIFQEDFYTKLYVRAVTFDPPGARIVLEKMNSRNDPLPIHHLDITNYLSSPNLVNCCHLHVGSLYRVIFKKLSKWSGKYTIQSHAMDNFVAAFDEKSGDAKQTLLMKSWPKLDLEGFVEDLKNLSDLKDLVTDLKKISNLKDLLGIVKNCITPNQLKAIYNIFALLKKCAQGELLGKEYANFLQLAQKTNTTHVAPQDLEAKALFDVSYKYHYKSEYPNYQKLHRRHIPKQLYRPLVNLLPKMLPCFYGLMQTAHDDIFTLKKCRDSRLFLDAVMQQGLEWLQTLGPQLTAHQRAFGPLPDVIVEKDNLPELPHQRNYIIERKETLQVLHHNFQKQPKQVMIGFGGMGKSTLALLYALAYFDTQKYYKTVWWFNAENEAALEDSISRVIKNMCIRLNDNANARQKMKKIQQALKKSVNWLLIFDNARGVLKVFLENVIRDAVTYTEHAKRKTVTA